MQDIHDNILISDEPGSDPLTWMDDIIGHINSASRYIALLAAWIATCGSLFMSEVLLWTPCVLCWYQRILMYPLVLILPIGILRRDRELHWYVLPLSLFGMGISLYHYLLVKTNLFPSPPCNASIPCTIEYLNVLGFINVPFLCLIAFLIISVMVFGSALGQADEVDELEGLSARSGVSVRSLIAVMAIIVTVIGVFVLWGVQIRG